MNCGEAKELIQLYLDDELDARYTLAVQRHIEMCDDCSRQLNALMVQDQSLRHAAQREQVDSNRLRMDILNAISPQPSVAKAITKTSWLTGRAKISIWERAAAVVILTTMMAVIALRLGLIPQAGNAVYAAVTADHLAHDSDDGMMGAMIVNQTELERLANTFARLNALPDLSTFGYGNPQGRICKLNDVEFLHLIYYHPKQKPLSLFICPHIPQMIAEKLTISRRNRFDVVSLSQSGIDLLVVSSLDQESTSTIARTIASRL